MSYSRADPCLSQAALGAFSFPGLKEDAVSTTICQAAVGGGQPVTTQDDGALQHLDGWPSVIVVPVASPEVWLCGTKGTVPY